MAEPSKVLEQFKGALRRSRNSKFYSQKFSDIKEDLTSLEEIGDLPFTTKEELREQAPFGTLCVDFDDVVEYHESFGTTGTSISTYLTSNDFAKWQHEIEISDVNFTKKDVVIIRFPYAISDPAHIFTAAVKNRGGMVIPASSRTVISPHTRVINLLDKLHATIICCMPLELIMLAETAKLLGYDPKKDFASLRALCTAGEVLSDERKKQIEDIWGVPIYNFYGTTENGNIAYTCKCGQLHIDEDDFYVESVDPVTGKNVKDGEKGILTVTNMTLEACPLIRYYTGDVVALEKSKCACGREEKILKHYGRKENVVRNGEQTFLIVDIQDAIIRAMTKELSPYFLICVTNKGLLIRLEKEEHAAEIDSDAIKARIEKELNCTCSVEILPYNHLFDRKMLLQVNPVIKPKYVADYRNTNNYPYTFNDMLRGYHTF